jgi:DivIVA domain-containing protein
LTTTAWFDGQDRLTPEDLQTVTFPMSRLGRRGYEEQSVRNFLSIVHSEFVRLLSQRSSLWQDVQRLRRRILTGADDDPQAVLFGEAYAHIRAARTLTTAQLTADRQVADAQAGGPVTEEARRRRDHIMKEAQQHSDALLEDARVRALEAAASALNRPAPPQTDRERQATQAELAYLRAYSEFYRAHLRAYTEGALRGIEGWERNEAAPSAQAAQGPDQRGIG